MPTPTKPDSKLKKITNWSFSRWREYCECPFKAYCKVILKLKEPGSKALDNGNRVHALAESYVSGKVPEPGYQEPPRSKEYTAELTKAASGKLPKELSTFTEEFKALRDRKYVTEQQWIFRSDWSQTLWNDWQGAWCRVKCDAHKVDGTHGVFVDYKTGKKYPEKHDESLELYAPAMFLVYPQLETVTAALWYLDIGEETVREFTRAEGLALLKVWKDKRTFKMLNDVRFTPRPSNFSCRYCFFAKDKNGPCKHTSGAGK